MNKVKNYDEFINESRNGKLEFNELSSATKKHAIEKYRNASVDSFEDMEIDDMTPDHPENLFSTNLYRMGLDDIDTDYGVKNFKVENPIFSGTVSNKSKFFELPGLNMVRLPNSMDKNEQKEFFKKLEQTDIMIEKCLAKVTIPESTKAWLKSKNANVDGLRKEMERNITIWAKKQSEEFGKLMQGAYDYASSDEGVSDYLINFYFNEKGNKVR